MKKIRSYFIITILSFLFTGFVQAQIDTVHLFLQDGTGKRGNFYGFPIYCNDLLTVGDSIISGEFTITHNGNIIDVIGFDTVGTMLGGVQSVFYNPVLKKIVFANAQPITGTGTLIYITIQVKANASGTTPLNLSPVMFNEGDPVVVVDPGSMRPTDIAINPKTPPSNKVVSDTLFFTASGDVTLPLTWSVSDTSVASINSSGRLIGKKVGQTSVLVIDGQGLSDQSNVFPINSPTLNSLTMTIRDTSFMQNLTFDLPIRISDVTSLGIISAQWKLNYNTNTLIAKSVITAGTMTPQSWGNPTVNFGTGTMDVAMAGADTLTGQGILAYVRFQVKRFATQSSNMTVQNILFNENINAAVDNGLFTVIPGPTITINPNVHILTRGDTLTYSASGGTPPYKWYSTDTGVVAVDSLSGKVRVKAHGSIILSAFDSQGFDDTLNIVVNDFLATLPDTTVRVGDSVDVPIYISDVTGLGIFAKEINIGYDTTKIRFTGLVTAGTISSGMTAFVNDSAAIIRMAFAGQNILSGQGIFAKLRFRHRSPAAAGQFSLLTFLKYQVNEGQPTATKKNGKITINPSLNQNPVFTKVMGDTTINEDQQLTFDYNAADPDTNQIKFSLQNQPTGMTIDSITGVLNWKPNFNQAGVYNFIVFALDGKGGSASRQTSVTVLDVNTNGSPQFTKVMGDTTINEDQQLTFDYNASDPDTDQVKFSLQNQPVGMTIDSVTGVLNWKPGFTQSGVHNFIVFALDGKGGSASKQTSITVQNVSRSPQFTKAMGDTTILENQQLTFDVNGVDPDNDPIYYALQNAPTGMSIDSLSGILNWKPAFTQSGNYTVTVLIVDVTSGSVSRQSNITVTNVNRAPQFTQTLPETTFAPAGQTFNFLFVGTDPDNDNMTFTAVEAPTGTSISAPGNFSWTPTLAQGGTHRLIVQLTDGSASVRDTSYFRIIVNNTPPFFTAVLSDTTISEGQTLSFLYEANDNENDTLQFALVSSPAGVVLSPAGQLTWTPNFTQAGVYTISVSVHDQQFTVSDTAKITVSNVNKPPQFTAVLQDVVAFVDSTINFAYAAFDPDNDNLTFSLVKAPSGAVIQTNGTFSWKPSANHLGKDTIIVSVSDGLLSVRDTAVLTVVGFPKASVSQTSFDFGSISFGGTKTLTTTVTNNGIVPLLLTLYQTNPPDPNFILDTSGTSIIFPGQSDTISITYSPKTVGGHFTGYLFMSNDPKNPAITFTANGSSIAKLAVTKKVMVDIHHNSTAPLTDTVNGMGQLFAFLQQSGIQVSFSDSSFTTLPGNDILLLVTPQKNYSRLNITAIQQFVNNGGMVIALGNSGQEGSNASLNILLTDTVWTTGLSLNTNLVVDSIANLFNPWALLLTTFADAQHPYFANVDTLVFFASASVGVTGTAIPFISTGPNGKTIGLPAIAQPAVVGLSKVGKGKIIVLGDADVWRVDSPNDSILPNITIKDNLAFAVNLFSITEDYEVKLPGKTLNERYQLVSIPFDLENSNVSSVLKDLGDPNPLVWRLFGRYDPLTGVYAEFPSEKFNSFRRGEAYWLITRGEFGLSLGSATVVPEQNFFPIKIGPGYSMIGNPFPYKVSWKHSIHDSVQNLIWGFNAPTFVAESLWLEPFTGYFVKNLTADTLTIYINPQDTSGVPFGKSSNAANSFNADEWRVGIAASSGKSSDETNFAGVAGGAKEEFDAYDVAEPPPSPTDYVVVRFPNTTWKRHPGSYAMDIRAANNEGLYWDFEVLTSKAHSRIELQLSELGNLPTDFAVYVVDKTSERVMRLEKTYRYEFTQAKNETRRMFRLLAGKTEYVEKNTQGIPLIAADYSLAQNYPNPFNPSTQIRYTLGHSGHVTLEIYNVLGQRVRSLKNEFQPIGTYSIEWDGKDDGGFTVSTGVYFYKVSAMSNGEKIFTETKKMILMK